MTIRETDYVLVEFDSLCKDLRYHGVPGRLTINQMTAQRLRERLVESMSALVLDEELADRQDEQRAEKVKKEVDEAVRIVSDGWSADPKDRTVTLDEGVWFDMDGCLRSRDGKFL